jgi:hypothetical protein
MRLIRAQVVIDNAALIKIAVERLNIDTPSFNQTNAIVCSLSLFLSIALSFASPSLLCERVCV